MNSETKTSPPSGNNEQFVRLFVQYEMRLHAYITSLMPNWSDADEVFQETSIALWNQFAEFEPGTNFFAWACRVAWFRVLKHREQSRRAPVAFSDEFLKTMQAAVEARSEVEARRQEAMEHCMGKLKGDDRELLSLRYADDATTQGVAEQLNRPLKSIYRSLNRIHELLLDCIRRRLDREARTP